MFLHYGDLPGTNHSPFQGFSPSEQPVATFVNSYILFFSFSAVPLWSLISGYLFFKDWRHARGFYLRRTASRTRSIFLPMLSWYGILGSACVAVRPRRYGCRDF